MPRALANRLLHLEITPSYESWRAWAVKRGINEKILGFLAFRTDYLMAEGERAEELAFATPRSWEMASNVLNYVCSDAERAQTLLGGILGTGVAHELCTWCRVYSQLPDVKSIFEGRQTRVPTSTDALYALVSSMTVYAREHKRDSTALANSIAYADRMPADFSTVLMKDYMALGEDFRTTLMRIPEFARWLRGKGRLLNGSI